LNFRSALDFEECEKYQKKTLPLQNNYGYLLREANIGAAKYQKKFKCPQ
jgi:hypothetical protein